MSSPRAENLLNICRIPLRWGDMDANGHVNNVLFFRFMEQARVEWLHTIDPKGQREPWISIMVVHVSCDFRLQMEYPGTVEVKTYAVSAGRSSVALRHEMRLVGDEQVRAEGRDKVVWVDTRINKSTPLPAPVRETFPFDTV